MVSVTGDWCGGGGDRERDQQVIQHDINKVTCLSDFKRTCEKNESNNYYLLRHAAVTTPPPHPHVKCDSDQHQHHQKGPNNGMNRRLALGMYF
jgi:hypothetical protein